MVCIQKAQKKSSNCVSQNNFIEGLSELKEIKAEQCYLNSRFDFCGIDKNNNNFVLEVKECHGDYEDIEKKKERIKIIVIENMTQK